MRILGQIAFAGVSLMALSAPAFAQEAPADEAASSEDIIVQARRKDESIQDVPLTVNAVSAAQIEKLNLRDLKDIAAVVPGLTLNPGNRTTGATISLRGLAIDNTTSGNNGTVQFYQNDAPISGGVVLQSMFDVGQVEVLRGPQGTLRGIASPSGSITITTKRPVMDEFGGYAAGQVNTNDGYKVEGAVNVPIVKDLLAIRVAAMYDKNEGSRVTSISRPGLEPYSKTKAVRISARWTPSPNFEVNTSYTHLVRDFLTFDQVESASIAQPTVAAAGTGATSQFITARDRLAVESVGNVGHMGFDVFNWQAEWRIAGQKLNYVGSYLRQDLRSTEPTDKGDRFGSTFPGDPAASNNNETYTSPAATLNLQNLAQASHSYPRFYSHEVRLSSDERLFGMLDYTVGFFMNKQSPWTDLVSITRANFTGGVPVTAADIIPANYLGTITTSLIARRGRSIERAVFGSLTLHLGDSTEISGGIRRLGYQENLNGANNKFNATIWNASVKHNFSDDLMVYASAGSSFRVGSGTNALILGRNVTLATVVDSLLLANIPITPERSKSYEIGLRSSWLDKRLTLNVSAFLQNFNNYIYPVSPYYVINNTGTTAAPILTNANVVLGISTTAAPVPAKIKGIEAEIGFRPSDRFNLAATIAYADAKLGNGSIPCNPTVAGGGTPTAADIQGNPPTPTTQQVFRCSVNGLSASRSAPFTASLQAEYNQPLSDNLNGFIRTLVSFYGNSTNDPLNDLDDVPAYALVNLYAGVRDHDNRWEITAYARNLFNTFRVTDRSKPLAGVATTAGTVNSNYRLISTTDPREFGITARFAIGSR